MVFFAGMAAFLANAFGIFLMRLRAEWTKRYEHQLIAAAAGLVIGIAFLHFGPELASHAPDQFAWIAVSFMSLYILEHHFAPHFHHGHPHNECEQHHKKVGFMTAVGFALHSVFDGVAIGVGVAFDWQIGVAAAIAVLAHEIPEGITTFSILRYSGYSIGKATAFALGVAAITPVVAFLSYLLFPNPDTPYLGTALALAMGSMLYIGATDLLPEAAHESGWQQTFLILLGFGIAGLLTLFGHGH